jgi:hypothetical protein
VIFEEIVFFYPLYHFRPFQKGQASIFLLVAV